MLEKLQFMAIMFVNELKTKHAERDERGATAVEYGLMVALIAAVIITAVALVGTRLDLLYNYIADRLPGA